ncbi:MAG: sialate O-acetylesterase [Flavobacteriaceae bacterium]|nr:sialate O-acetylesterase [Flavobacteriaceae bacterium]
MVPRFFVLMFFMCGFGRAQTLPNFFSDSMVLQQKDSVPFWGTDQPEQMVSITTSWGAQATVKTDSEGEWKTQLVTPAAGGPYDIYIAGTGKDTLKNVLIGEVWLAAGQSNMHIPLKGYRNTPIEGAMEALVNSKNSKIRFFRINRNPTLSPEDNVSGDWKESNPENAQEFSAVGYFFASLLQKSLDVPVGIITTSWGGSKVQAWLGKKSVKKFPELKIPEVLGESAKDKRTTPTSLYNGMLLPLQDYAIKGVLWYQGESDRETENYQGYFTELIRSWRDQWKDQSLPFYFVQIAPFSYDELNPVPGGDAARVRNAQLQTYLTVHNTGMVVSMDAGDCKDVHPSRKKIIGDRLAYWALADTYGWELPHESPVFKKAVYSQNDQAVKVYFDHAPFGFIKQEEIKGFSLSINGKTFEETSAQIGSDGNILIPVKNDFPKFIRFGYGDCIQTNLKSTFGFPVSPFKGVVEAE